MPPKTSIVARAAAQHPRTASPSGAASCDPGTTPPAADNDNAAATIEVAVRRPSPMPKEPRLPPPSPKPRRIDAFNGSAIPEAGWVIAPEVASGEAVPEPLIPAGDPNTWTKKSAPLFWDGDPRQPRNVPEVFMVGVDPMRLQQVAHDLRALGIHLDQNNGHLSYAPGFAAIKLTFELVVARHGATPGNMRPRVFQGQVDGPLNQLTQKGRLDAVSCCDRLRSGDYAAFRPDAIIVSPLTRAVDTARPYATAMDLQVQPDPRVTEQHWGAVENLCVASIHPQYRTHLGPLHQNAIVKATGGESFAETVLRAANLLCAYNSEYAGKRVVVFAHSMIVKALLVCVGLEQTGHDKDGGTFLGFDGGDYIVPHATPIRCTRP